ncbi:MAG TPA: class I SAM-dependent methyltransferase [Verrucomicrobiae bacterium]|jgi:SAM-dependent methyltransferase|nr:class I SAM-dependent methyltransferase [Verrucomicrobiae bacterium]
MNFWQIYSKPYLRLESFFPYQQLRNRFMEFLEIKDDKVYLDAGCGPGLFIQDRHNIIGADFSEAMLQSAREANPHSSFLRVDLNERLPFEDGAFDGVYSNNVLAYLKNPRAVLEEFARVLKPDGTLVVSTLRRSFNPFSLIEQHFHSGGRITSLKSFLVMLWTLALNVRIVFKLWKGEYHGFEIEDLRKAASAAGFELSLAEWAYARQNVLIVARKSVCAEPLRLTAAG